MSDPIRLGPDDEVLVSADGTPMNVWVESIPTGKTKWRKRNKLKRLELENRLMSDRLRDLDKDSLKAILQKASASHG